MPPSRDGRRCWLCDNAIWFLPAWTWSVALVTGVAMLALVRPDAVMGWLWIMGVLVICIGAGVAVAMDENHRDRASAAKTAAQPAAAAVPARAQPVRKAR